MNYQASLAQAISDQSGAYLLGRPMPRDPNGKREAGSVPPKVVAYRIERVVGARDTPRRACSCRRTLGASEKKVACN